MKKLKKLLTGNRFYMALGIGIVYSAISVLLPTASGNLITSAVSETGISRSAIGIFLGIGILQLVFYMLDLWASDSFKIEQKSGMRREVFKAFLRGNQADRNATGAFVSFINNDIPVIAEQYIAGFTDIVKCLCIIVLSSLSMLAVHWSLAVIIVVISVLIVSLPAKLGKKSGEIRKAYSGSLAAYNTTLRSILDGVEIVRAYLAQKRAKEKHDLSEENVRAAELKLMKRQLTVYLLTGALQIGKTVLVILVGVHLIREGKIAIGGLVAVIQLSEMIGAPIEVLAYLRHSRKEAEPLADEYLEKIAEKGREGGEHAGPVFEELEVKELKYSVEEVPILRGVNFRLKNGEKVLVTGESGSGKSTLLRAIARSVDDYEGNILLNGQDEREICAEDYYRMICPVGQEPYLFYASLEENIRMGREIPRDQYTGIIRKLNLGYLLERYQDEEITAEVMEKLSGGEKQRVALARAMAGEPQVYLLDEVTSALDAETTELVEKSILETDAAVIHVCHKPAAEIRVRYDAKYRMADGRLSREED